MDYSKEVEKLINVGKFNFTTMSEYLGISRPTLYKRLFDSSWKKGEKELIKRLM